MRMNWWLISRTVGIEFSRKRLHLTGHEMGKQSTQTIFSHQHNFINSRLSEFQVWVLFVHIFHDVWSIMNDFATILLLSDEIWDSSQETFEALCHRLALKRSLKKGYIRNVEPNWYRISRKKRYELWLVQEFLNDGTPERRTEELRRSCSRPSRRLLTAAAPRARARQPSFSPAFRPDEVSWGTLNS